VKAYVLALLFGVAMLSAQGPPRERYHAGKLIKISASEGNYSYTIETSEDGYMCKSSQQLRLTQGSQVQFVVEGRSLFIIDEDGKPQETSYQLQYLRPPPPPPPKQ
jgi:hypothetical protein